MSIGSEYKEIMNTKRVEKAREEQTNAESGDYNAIPKGMNFRLCADQYDGRPYIKCSCSDCKMIVEVTGTKAVFFHCGVEYPIPQELLDRLEAQQIKRGIRRKPTVIQRIKGETPALAPRLNNF